MLFYLLNGKKDLMGTAERRLEILKYLCKFREATMPQLAEIFGVSVRTIQRDILEIEATFHVPLDIRCGKYDGGIYVMGDYSFDRSYMHDDELMLLSKVKKLVNGQLTEKEKALFAQIIKTYTKIA